MRPPAREISHRPAVADDPVRIGMGRGVGDDSGKVGGSTTQAAQVTLQTCHSGLDRVNVSVAEAGRHRSAAQVDHARLRPDQRLDVGIGTDARDPAVADRDRRGDPSTGVHGGDTAGAEDEIGWSLDGHSRRMPCQPATRRTGTIAVVTSVHLLHAGYTGPGDHVGSSISLIGDGDVLIVADPGMVADRSLILDPLAALGIVPEAVTHVFLSHHHPDHTVNIALFPNAEVVDFWARYRGDLWLDHPGDGHRLGANSELWLTPGHTDQDATLVVSADDGVYALTHLWWRSDRTPEVDPLGSDQAAIERGRARVLAVADVVIPGHGEPFRVNR